MYLYRLNVFTQRLYGNSSETTSESNTTDDIPLESQAAKDFQRPTTFDEVFQLWEHIFTIRWRKIEEDPLWENWENLLAASLEIVDQAQWELDYQRDQANWRREVKKLRARGNFGPLPDEESKQKLWYAMFFRYSTNIAAQALGRPIENDRYLGMCEEVLRKADPVSYQNLPRYWPPFREVDEAVKMEWCRLSEEKKTAFGGSLYRYRQIKRLEWRDARGNNWESQTSREGSRGTIPLEPLANEKTGFTGSKEGLLWNISGLFRRVGF